SFFRGALSLRPNPSFIDPDQWREIAKTVGKLADWPLFIDDSPSLSIQALLARARLCIRRFGRRLVILDYLRLIKAPGRELREQVGNAAYGSEKLRALKSIVQGYFNYYAVPGNTASLSLFRHRLLVLWWHTVRRRSQPTAPEEATMKSRQLTLITKTIVFVAFAIPLQLTAQHTRYTVTDLGTLGGTFSLAGGLNNKALVEFHRTR